MASQPFRSLVVPEIYYIPDSSSTASPSAIISLKAKFKEIDNAHIFRGRNFWFVASHQKPEVSNLMVHPLFQQFSCEPGHFLDAAVDAVIRAPTVVSEAYRRVANDNGLERDLVGLLRIRKNVVAECLNAMLLDLRPVANKLILAYQCLSSAAENHDIALQLTGDLCALRVSLRRVRDCRLQKVVEHPESLTQAVDFHTVALREFECGMNDALKQLETAMANPSIDGWRYLAVCMANINDSLIKELEDLERDIADLESDVENTFTAIPVEHDRPTFYQSLLHLGLILLSSESAGIRRLRRPSDNIALWSRRQWEDQFQLPNTYEGLCCILTRFRPFSNLSVRPGALEEQTNALISGLRQIAGEVPVASVPPKNKEFSGEANIMIVCACAGIFPLDRLSRYAECEINFENYFLTLSSSPLYADDITPEKAVIHVSMILSCLYDGFNYRFGSLTDFDGETSMSLKDVQANDVAGVSLSVCERVRKGPNGEFSDDR